MESNDIPSEAPAEPKKPSSGNGLLITLILILQLGMIGYYAYQYHLQPHRNLESSFVTNVSGISDEQLESIRLLLEDITEEMTRMDKDLVALEAHVDTLESGAFEPAYDELDQRITALENGPEMPVDASETTTISDARIDAVLAIVQDVEQLRGEIESSGAARWKTIQLLTSFERLEHQILRYEPYQAALYAFRLASETLQDQEQWINALNTYQHEGIPSSDSLRAQFEAAREAVLSASGDETMQEDVIDTVTRNLSKLIEIRKVGPEHTGNDAESVLARAYYAFEQSELDMLQQELSQLPGQSAQYFEDFVGELEQQQRILNLLPEMRAAIEATISFESTDTANAPDEVVTPLPVEAAEE